MTTHLDLSEVEQDVAHGHYSLKASDLKRRCAIGQDIILGRRKFVMERAYRTFTGEVKGWWYVESEGLGRIFITNE